MGTKTGESSSKPRDAQLPSTLDLGLVSKLLGWNVRISVASAENGSWPVTVTRRSERRYACATRSLSKWLEESGIAASAAAWLDERGEFERLRIDRPSDGKATA